MAGKSGTTDSEKTAALVAMTKQYAVAGIMADPDWPQTNVKMKHGEKDGINPPVWETLRDAMKGKTAMQFEPPGQKISEGDQRSIPEREAASRWIRRSPGSRVPASSRSVSDAKVTSSCPAGTAAGTSPDGRTIKGGVVTIQVSNGGGGTTPGNTGGPGGPGQPGNPPGRPGGGGRPGG